MAPSRKILVADADPATARRLAPALRRQGYQVHTARDGSRALQLAILRSPDLVLFDERCPLLDPRTFARILRANPRTARIPVVVLGEGEAPARARLAGFLGKPLREEEVLARIGQVLQRVEASRAVAAEGRELEGSLAELPLADLLQILAANRKSGRLSMGREGDRAEVLLRDGRATDATAGPVSGEKALFRLLGRREGTFSFAPEAPSGPVHIDRRMDELVLEGLRQVDETAALRPSLPAPADQLELTVPPDRIPPDLHPVTAEVVALLDRPSSLAELLDRSAASDLEALRAVAALLETGWARRRAPPAAAAATAPLLDPAEIHQLRARIGRGRSGGSQAVGKVLLAGGGPLARRAALARFAAIAGFETTPASPAGLGALGRLTIGEGLEVDLTELPLEPELLPAWRAFAPGALGAVVLLPADGLEEEHAALLRDLRVPVVVVGPSAQAVPAPLADGPQPAAFHGLDPAEALRALLAGAGRAAAGTRIAPP